MMDSRFIRLTKTDQHGVVFVSPDVICAVEQLPAKVYELPAGGPKELGTRTKVTTRHDGVYLVEESSEDVVAMVSVSGEDIAAETREVLASVLHRFGHLGTDAGRYECLNEVEALLAKLEPTR